MTAQKQLMGAALLVALALTGCAGRRIPLGELPQQKIAKANKLLAIANSTAIDVTIQLSTAGVLKTDQAAEALAYERKVATVTAGVAAILDNPGEDWTATAVKIKALVDSVVPPSFYIKWAGVNDVQYQALATAVQGVVSGLQLMALELQ